METEEGMELVITFHSKTIITWVVSRLMVKIASCKLPKKESMTKAPDTITTPIILKFGELLASANVKRINPTTRRTAEKYSRGGYFLLKPGMKAPIIITGKTYKQFRLKNIKTTNLDPKKSIKTHLRYLGWFEH